MEAIAINTRSSLAFLLPDDRFRKAIPVLHDLSPQPSSSIRTFFPEHTK
jgi:hypothetical protein